MTIGIVILPNQLFEKPFFIKYKKNSTKIYLYEHPNFFTKYKYHKLKLVYHRATMKKYQSFLKGKGFKVEYIDHNKSITSIYRSHKEIEAYEPCDFSIAKDFMKNVKKYKNNVKLHDNQLFILTLDEIDEYTKGNVKSKYINREFYKWVRVKKDILLNKGKPIGGKWSFDSENRNAFPKGQKEVTTFRNANDSITKEAIKYVEKYFNKNPGEINMYLPIDYSGAKSRLNDFLKKRLKNFGKYQDAVSSKVNFGYHSILSPMINIGLLDPMYVINKTEEYYKSHKSIPLASVEGFIRQIASWREYVRMFYQLENTKLTKGNFFKHNRAIGKEWYDGTTDIPPIDDIIKKVLKYGYAHHIERLMFLGNFMLLNRFKPKEIYKWFISIVSIDAYPWVMVPNVYGMSQFSCGGLMMTRPYFSSSNYVIKMSDYTKSSGDKLELGKDEYTWAEVWDGLYYYFIKSNRTFLKKNYSTASSVKHWDNKKKSEQDQLVKVAKLYLKHY
jgi:deoxyribodipyrimidine photolyase-related protein